MPRIKIPSSFAFNNSTSNKKIPSLKSSATTTKSATDAIALKNNSNNHYNRSSKLFDKISIHIISELLTKQDVSSKDLSNKLGIPLSTIQRRRAIIERSILRKEYIFDFKAFGARVGDLIVNVDKGRSREIAQLLLQKHNANVISVDLIINSTHNVIAHIVYKDSKELHDLIASVSSMEYVNDVSWSEVVEEYIGQGNNSNNNKLEVVKALIAYDNH